MRAAGKHVHAQCPASCLQKESEIASGVQTKSVRILEDDIGKPKGYVT